MKSGGHAKPVIREIFELCKDTWEARKQICHFKEKLKEEQRRKEIDYTLTRFQYLLKEENCSSKLLRLKFNFEC